MGSESSILVFPDAGLRAALAVLRRRDAPALENQLAASVVLVCARNGDAVPPWAVRAALAIANHRG